MPACNFKGRFAARVLRQTKTTTVRRGVRFAVGDRFVGYYGMRTKRTVKLAEGRVVSAEVIQIARMGNGDVAIFVGGQRLDAEASAVLALADGFPFASECGEFFEENYGLPVEGQLVRWEPEVLPEKEMKLRLARLAEFTGGAA